MSEDTRGGPLRALPSVDEIVRRLEDLTPPYPRGLVLHEVRRAIQSARNRLRASEACDASGIESEVRRNLARLARPSLRRVINATGVILHTNLGRAPLPCFEPIAGYCNLEYDLETGRRGKRDVHAGALLERLLERPAIAVNNNAAAVYLALRELASGGEVVVSRGELIEIGDGFRIPDIMAQSGAVLREVGTTNRTRIEDYREAINERTRLLLRVHPSNFRIVGFTARPALSELVALGRERGIPVYEDLGSGCLVDLAPYGLDEPRPQESLRTGANLVSFSADKMLGGPQAGILAGDLDIIARLRRNPMYRALRLDKLILQALETTLRYLLLERWEDVPAMRMIREPAARIRERAERLVAQLPPGSATVVPGESVIGGGSTPAQSLPTWLVAIECAEPSQLEARLRLADPPVIARIRHDRLLLDLRTVFADEEPHLLDALRKAMT
ncbi:MAG: L-seryl-tRNA(Sec) selenium transferase [Bryobacterales bacterium]|nr:L-seryl-tRNA(Sec) selenium transferase [Bryobacterales bacterium]